MKRAVIWRCARRVAWRWFAAPLFAALAQPGQPAPVGVAQPCRTSDSSVSLPAGWPEWASIRSSTASSRSKPDLQGRGRRERYALRLLSEPASR